MIRVKLYLWNCDGTYMDPVYGVWMYSSLTSNYGPHFNSLVHRYNGPAELGVYADIYYSFGRLIKHIYRRGNGY